MIEEKKLKKFLNLFQYGDDKEKQDIIKYIISVVKQANEENKILTFDKLQDQKYFPNPFIDNKGKLFMNTDLLNKIYLEYCEKTKYVETEIANMVIDSYKILNDIITTPIDKI